MSLTLENLLERGYLPQELPPPFVSQRLAKFVAAEKVNGIPFVLEPTTSIRRCLISLGLARFDGNYRSSTRSTLRSLRT